MAGDWLKVEAITPDKPEIWRMADLLDIDPDAVFGKVFRVWAYFDAHTEQGNAPSVTKALLDRQVSVSGFIDCMISVGWMHESDDGLTIPKFDDHNGQSAKRRANTAKRVAKHKKCTTESNAEGNGQSVTKSVSAALPREEKSREESNTGTAASRVFVKPTVQQVHDYIVHKGYQVDAAEFVDFYDCNGWVQSRGKKIKDWQACVRTWQHRTKKKKALSLTEAELVAKAEAMGIATVGLNKFELAARVEAKK